MAKEMPVFLLVQFILSGSPLEIRLSYHVDNVQHSKRGGNIFVWLFIWLNNLFCNRAASLTNHGNGPIVALAAPIVFWGNGLEIF